MEFLYIILSFLFFILYWKERARYKAQSNQIVYISEALESILENDGHEYIRIPSDHTAVKKIAVSTNNLLESYYKKGVEYQCFRKTMQRTLTNISHDFKTPLTVVNGYSEIILQKLSAKEPASQIHKLVSKLNQKTKELVRTVNQFFTMARLDSGDLQLTMASLDINRLCQDILLDFYDILEEMDFSVNVPQADHPVYVLADEDALNRILKNLIDNAVKYGKDGRYLGVSIQERKTDVLVSISDRGMGIPDQELDQIFQRHYSSIKEGQIYCGRSGLGLSISKSLAEHMGGEITSSSIPGKETIFCLTLNKVRKT